MHTLPHFANVPLRSIMRHRDSTRFRLGESLVVHPKWREDNRWQAGAVVPQSSHLRTGTSRRNLDAEAHDAASIHTSSAQGTGSCVLWRHAEWWSCQSEDMPTLQAMSPAARPVGAPNVDTRRHRCAPDDGLGVRPSLPARRRGQLAAWQAGAVGLQPSHLRTGTSRRNLDAEAHDAASIHTSSAQGTGS
jgi:hypothetical protein